MIPVTIFAGRDVAVFGHGLERHRRRACARRGRRASVRLGRRREAARRGGGRRALLCAISPTADWTRFAALVLAPGVPLTHPEPHWSGRRARAQRRRDHRRHRAFLPRARASKARRAKVIAITGTNGKSTTTALTAPSACRRPAGACSSAAISARRCSTWRRFADGRHYVLELSSFQIDLTPACSRCRGICSTSRPTISTATARSKTTPRVKARIFAGSGAGGRRDRRRRRLCRAIADEL